jgi:hypothetical protein
MFMSTDQCSGCRSTNGTELEAHAHQWLQKKPLFALAVFCHTISGNLLACCREVARRATDVDENSGQYTQQFRMMRCIVQCLRL